MDLCSLFIWGYPVLTPFIQAKFLYTELLMSLFFFFFYLIHPKGPALGNAGAQPSLPFSSELLLGMSLL